MFSYLKGKRTYLCAIAIGIVTVLHQLGYLDGTSFTTLLGIFGGGGLAALRAAIPAV